MAEEKVKLSEKIEGLEKDLMLKSLQWVSILLPILILLKIVLKLNAVVISNFLICT